MGNASSQPAKTEDVVEDGKVPPDTESSSAQIPISTASQHDHGDAKASTTPQPHFLSSQFICEPSPDQKPLISLPQLKAEPNTRLDEVENIPLSSSAWATKKTRTSTDNLAMSHFVAVNMDTSLSSSAVNLEDVNTQSPSVTSKKRKRARAVKTAEVESIVPLPIDSESPQVVSPESVPKKKRKRDDGDSEGKTGKERKRKKKRYSSQPLSPVSQEATDVSVNITSGDVETQQPASTIATPKERKKKKRTEDAGSGDTTVVTSQTGENTVTAQGSERPGKVEVQNASVSSGKDSSKSPKANGTKAKSIAKPLSKEFVTSDTDSEVDAPSSPAALSEAEKGTDVASETAATSQDSDETSSKDRRDEDNLADQQKDFAKSDEGAESQKSEDDSASSEQVSDIAQAQRSAVSRGKQRATPASSGWRGAISRVIEDVSVLDESRDGAPDTASNSITKPKKKRRLPTNFDSPSKDLDSGTKPRRPAIASSSKISSRNKSSSTAHGPVRDIQAGPSRAKPSSKTASGKSKRSESDGSSQCPSFKTGPFEDEESEAIGTFRDQWCDDNQKNELQFIDICHQNARNNPRVQEFWKDMQETIPDRPVVALQKYCRRKFHPYDKRAADWTADEDREIKTLVAQHGKAWVTIGKTMDRHPEDLRDRYRNYLIAPDRDKNKWSNFDIQKLRHAVGDCALSIMKEDAGDGEDFFNGKYVLDNIQQFLERGSSLLSWDAISLELDGRRTRLQCSYKWRKLESDGETSLKREFLRAWERLTDTKLREILKQKREGKNSSSENEASEKDETSQTDETAQEETPEASSSDSPEHHSAEAKEASESDEDDTSSDEADDN